MRFCILKSTGIIDNFQNQKENTLHVAIALESIKKDEIVKQEVATNGVARQYSPSFTISIADYFRKINPSDESFYKYIPKKFLKDNNSGSIKYSLKDGKAVDNGGAVRYNRKKIAHYISYAKLGSETVQYIRSELKKIYGNDDGVADGIAIAKGEKIYVIDSGRENGKINFGVRNIRTIRDVSFR